MPPQRPPASRSRKSLFNMKKLWARPDETHTTCAHIRAFGQNGVTNKPRARRPQRRPSDAAGLQARCSTAA